jgi:tRNA A37 threonylcarbamoyltransferase TsaD
VKHETANKSFHLARPRAAQENLSLALTGIKNKVRTRIYLTERQRDEPVAIDKIAGKKQSRLIREAIDRLIDHAGRMGQ